MANSSGGLEMLFSNKRQHALVIPAADQDGKPANIANLIDHLCQNVMDDSRKDLFVLNNHLYVLVTACLPLCYTHSPGDPVGSNKHNTIHNALSPYLHK